MKLVPGVLLAALVPTALMAAALGLERLERHLLDQRDLKRTHAETDQPPAIPADSQDRHQ